MDQVYSYLLKFLNSELHKTRAILAGILLELFIFLPLDSFLEKMPQIGALRYYCYLLIVTITLIIWMKFRFYQRKNSKNKVGIIICIYAESDIDQLKLKHDFVNQLQKEVGNENLDSSINILVIKNHIAEKIKQIKDLKNLHKKAKGHFYLWGQIKLRNDGERKYFLSLEGMVTHRPIKISKSNELASDFINLLPKEISFAEAFDFKGFRLTSELVYIAVKYITGMAAFLSGDPFLAYKLHSNLEKDFAKFNPLPPNLLIIKNKLPGVISEEQLVISRHKFLKNDILSAKQFLDDSFRFNPSNYGAWLFKAVYDFSILKDPKLALIDIKKSKKFSNGTSEWRYSEAFLYFWLEKYSEALKSCERIENHTYDNEYGTLQEVENFNLNLLKTEQNKAQLYFWLGFIKFKKEFNYPVALEYLEKFKSLSNESQSILLGKSDLYIKEIKKTIGY